MNRLVYLLVLAIMPVFISAQAPKAFSYQAVLRDQAGDLRKNTDISVRVSIVKKSDNTTPYTESHVTKTNQFGLFALQIGNGSQKVGDFSAIKWGSSTLFLKVEVAEGGTSNYILQGESEMLSVPYALYAESAGSSGWVKDDRGINYTGGNVGVGLPSDSRANLNVKSSLGIFNQDNKPILAFSQDAPNTQGGILSLISNEKRVISLNSPGNAGIIGLYGPKQLLTGYIGGWQNKPDAGAFQFYNSSGFPILTGGVDPGLTESGILSLNGKNGIKRIELSFLSTQFPDRGYIGIRSEDGIDRINEYVNVDNSGIIQLFGSNKKLNITARGFPNYPNNGYFAVHDTNGVATAFVTSNPFKGGNGSLGILGSKGTKVIGILGSLDDDHPNNGYLTISDGSGLEKVELYSTGPENAGSIRVSNSLGQTSFEIRPSPVDALNSLMVGYRNEKPSFLLGFVEDGPGMVLWGKDTSAIVISAADSSGYVIALHNKLGETKIELSSYDDKGTISADELIVTGVKNFKIPYPNNQDKEIWYACIEGPEAAAYTRGTAKLINGEAKVALPDHFSAIIDESSITVILTPLSADSKGLAVTSKQQNHIDVKELMQGKGNYSFDWEVKAIRKGYEDYQPVRKKLDEGVQQANYLQLHEELKKRKQLRSAIPPLPIQSSNFVPADSTPGIISNQKN